MLGAKIRRLPLINVVRRHLDTEADEEQDTALFPYKEVDMRIGSVFAFLAVVSMATAVNAQTKISGKNVCGPQEGQQALEVGDNEGHVFSISQSKCVWGPGFMINGVKATAGVSTAFDDISGGKSKTSGYYVDTMDNGDKAHYRWWGKAMLKGEAVDTAEIECELKGGTGKIEGVKGSGKCTGKGNEKGGVTWDCTGSYTST